MPSIKPLTVLLLAIVLGAVVSCATPATAQGSSCGAQAPGGPPATGNIAVSDGSQPGEIVISWDYVPQAAHYRIGYVNMETDYPLAKASKTGCWTGAFTFVDVEAQNFTVADGRVEYTARRLQQGVRHAFTVRTARNPHGAFTWPRQPRWTFHEVADRGGACPAACPAPTAAPQPTPTPSRPPVSGGDPKYGGTLRMSAYYDPGGWSPLHSPGLASVAAYSQLYNQLVQYDAPDVNAITGDLAESWEVSSDGRSVTFRLRDGMQWNDGTAITAEDVTATFINYANPCKTSESWMWRNYAVKLEVVDQDGGDCTPTNAMSVLRAFGPLTVQFYLQSRWDTFLKFLAIDNMKVLPAHLLRAGVNLDDASALTEYNSGSGPYVLEEYRARNFYKVNRNRNYFKDGRPYVDRIEHYIFTGEERARLIATFAAGNLDMTNSGLSSLSPRQYYALEEDSNGAYLTHPVAAGANWGLMINVKEGFQPWDDVRIRLAVNLAIDRQEIDERVFGNSGGSYCPLLGLAHANEECNSWPGIRPKDSAGGREDLSEARRLMAESGYPDGIHQIRYTAPGHRSHLNLCWAVGQQLEDTLGIIGYIAMLPGAAGYDKYGTSRAEGSARDWDISCQSAGLVIFDADAVYSSVYLKGGARNYTNWSNAQIDDWFAAQQAEPDLGKRREINKEAELWLNDFSDNHWVTLQLGRFFWLVHRDVKGFNAPSTIYHRLKHEDLWLDR